MLKFNVDKAHIKLLWFYLAWWVVGIVIATVWGLGWFFLIETLRRIVTYFPPFRRRLRALILGTDVETEITTIAPATKKASQIMGWVILMCWIGLTIFVFMRANISLFTIIEYLRAVK